MNNIKKVIDGEIIALLPVYIKGKGNSTKVILNKSDDLIINSKLRRVLKNVSGYFALDLRALKREYGDVINSKNLIPIPLNCKDVLIPVKSRIPIAKNDGSIGYFNIRYIDDVIKKEDIYIKLKNERLIKVINNESTIKKHINEGKIVRQVYNERMNNIKEDKYFNYRIDKSPATKEDIAIIIKELMELKHKL